MNVVVIDEYMEALLGGASAMKPVHVAQDMATGINTHPSAPSAKSVKRKKPSPRMTTASAASVAPADSKLDPSAVDSSVSLTATDTATGNDTPPPIIAPQLPADMITDDEFESLLDSLHGTAAPGAIALPTLAHAAPLPSRAPHTPPTPAVSPVPRRAPHLPTTAQKLWHPLLSSAAEPKQHARTEESSRWLHLRCNHQHYAVELLKVQEVMVPVPLLPLRGTGLAMLGVMNLRGLVVPVIDLGIRLGLSPILHDPAARIVVLEQQGETLGLMVSTVDDVITLRTSQIESPEHARIGRNADPMFRGVSRQPGVPRPVILLDAHALLDNPI